MPLLPVPPALSLLLLLPATVRHAAVGAAVGVAVGSIVGDTVGAMVGAIVGAVDGEAVGARLARVGLAVLATVGLTEGTWVAGVGSMDGVAVGAAPTHTRAANPVPLLQISEPQSPSPSHCDPTGQGWQDSPPQSTSDSSPSWTPFVQLVVVGVGVGTTVGARVGARVGVCVGLADDARVGADVGEAVGSAVGVGCVVGAEDSKGEVVGTDVGNCVWSAGHPASQ